MPSNLLLLSQIAKSTPYDDALVSPQISVSDVQAAIDYLKSAIATGLLNYNLESQTAFTTGSTTDVVITGFTLTPQAGTYAVFFNGASFLTTTPRNHWWSLYKAGIKVTGSERQQRTSASNQNMVDSLQSIVTVTGSQALDIRVRTENGSLTMNARSLLLIRLGA